MTPKAAKSRLVRPVYTDRWHTVYIDARGNDQLSLLFRLGIARRSYHPGQKLDQSHAGLVQRSRQLRSLVLIPLEYQRPHNKALSVVCFGNACEDTHGATKFAEIVAVLFEQLLQVRRVLRPHEP